MAVRLARTATVVSPATVLVPTAGMSMGGAGAGGGQGVTMANMPFNPMVAAMSPHEPRQVCNGNTVLHDSTSLRYFAGRDGTHGQYVPTRWLR